MGKTTDAMSHLREAMKLNTTLLAKDPKWRDLRPIAEQDPEFAAMRALPEYKALMSQP